MDTTYAERHVRAVELARRCLFAGARISTVEYLTGLDRVVLRRYFFDKADPPKPGKRPDSLDAFLKNATLLTMVDSSVLYCSYRRHLEHWPCRAEALLSGYLQYKQDVVQPELAFDRAFYLVCWTDGLWATTERGLRFVSCRLCHSRYITPLTLRVRDARDCPFCRLWSRYGVDPRVQSRFPERRHENRKPAVTSFFSLRSDGHDPRPAG